ncbi:flavin reductase family protein [Paenarthrobacter aurescens]|uniref:Flavin oxidoreductase n=1 Tax=Paenarthrobacter aurescens TaxID=43663 RepID=A0A4Y3NJ20_PAEAU|nr:flavin reductase family protein [Paenarthrobacter aurescens]MDO6141914.1 flavin reductase family protein [Paenarthrobacter aurescens]MDO6145719.1 flavin reductase family protein [Paenarthrobacter aurescens]MDO6156963.1 flavin reductase family protein [Paenarthrobacter aurescens]MDO6160949.1 flavin reductase family protein [Paenarthrobacter aurescens]GEB19126.1 flavin oxidoreductase [Paenarthrobacter aurescens]
MTHPKSLPSEPVGELFKAAFRAHPAGVSIVTAMGPEGAVGLTASSVASVAVDPPTLAFSVTGGRSASHIAAAQTIVVHLIGADHLDLARTFADPGAPRFTDGMEWELLPTGEPLLTEAAWALRCEIIHRAPLGGSVLLAARVLEIRATPSGSAPLIYHNREFHTLLEGIPALG